jgi:D-3-phosphoglycerate dehydrogenase / 2-oxoglutarate reductase
MYTVLVTDHPAPSTDVEAGVLAAVGARLVLAETGSESELVALAPEADAILTCFKHVTPAVVKAAPRLRVIGRYGVGVDNIAVETATERGVVVANVPVYCVDEVAEHSIAMLLALARKIVRYDGAVRAGRWEIETGMPIHRLAGSVLGVVGYGHIGRAVAARARGLNMRVLVSDPSESPDVVRADGAEPRSLDELLRESDAVSLHAPLSSETRHMVDARRLATMKPGAFLVNCARGAIIDHDALATALQEGRIGGAALDVFEPERLPVGHALFGLDNVVLTPHVAFYSEESIAELQHEAASNVAAVLSGRQPASTVNGVTVAGLR